MEKAAVLILLLAGASALAPTAKLTNPSKACPFMECPPKLDGTMVGDMGFDPMGISNTLPDLRYARAAELKHGRIAQLAVVGFLWQEKLPHLGGVPGYEEINPLAAPSSVPFAANVQIFLAIAIAEFIMECVPGGAYGTGEPGDFGFGASFLKGKSDAQVKKCVRMLVCLLGFSSSTVTPPHFFFLPGH